MNKLIVGILAASAVVVTYFAADSYFRSKRDAEYARLSQAVSLEPIAPDSELPPSLYPCIAPDKEILYMVIAVSGEFMMFDQDGVWVTNGTFFKAKTDKNVEYYHAEVGSNLLGMFKTPNDGWHLVMSTQQGATELKCL